MRIPKTVLLGFALIAASYVLYSGPKHWLATRKFVALNEPVSLASGSSYTADFTTNVSGGYAVYFDLDYSPSWSGGCTEDSLRTKWAVSKSGVPVAREQFETTSDGSSQYSTLGWFEAGHGTYRLSLKVVSETSCLNARNPRIRISTDPSPYENLCQFLTYLAALFVFGGAALLIRIAIGQIPGLETGDAVFEKVETVGPAHTWSGNLWPSRNHAPQSATKWIPRFALFTVTGMSLLMFVFIVITAISLIPPRGHWIYTRPIYTPSYQPADLLIVRVEDNHQEIPNCFVSDVSVKCPDILWAVKRELVRRNDWVVFVEGNPALDFEQVARVIGQIQKSGAKVVLLTPKLKREFLGKKPRQ